MYCSKRPNGKTLAKNIAFDYLYLMQEQIGQFIDWILKYPKYSTIMRIHYREKNGSLNKNY